ncbi:MAG: hypothetical protein JW832_06275 [Deltaproteobacteria bacterium]|nr:hypothetical protein [Deltaproteobacteria bacterium]
MTFGRIVFSLLSVCMLCTGCYESKYPLSSSDASRIDSRLLKCWLEEPHSPGDRPYRVEICKFNEREYFVAFSNDNGTATIARAFTSMIDNVPVLNMQGIETADPHDRTFVFFKYSFAPDGALQTWMISSDSPLLEKKTFSSQASFGAYIKKHIHDKLLFGDMQRFKQADGLHLKFFSKP